MPALSPGSITYNMEGTIANPVAEALSLVRISTHYLLFACLLHGCQPCFPPSQRLPCLHVLPDHCFRRVVHSIGFILSSRNFEMLSFVMPNERPLPAFCLPCSSGPLLCQQFSPSDMFVAQSKSSCYLLK